MPRSHKKMTTLTFDETFGALARAGHIPLAPYSERLFRRAIIELRREIIRAAMCYLRRPWRPCPPLSSPWLRQLAISFVEDTERSNSLRIEALMLRALTEGMVQAGLGWNDLMVAPGKQERFDRRKPRRKARAELGRQKKLAKAEARKSFVTLIECIANGWLPGVVSPNAGLLPKPTQRRKRPTEPMDRPVTYVFCNYTDQCDCNRCAIPP
jgi:hypothetical protein